MRTPASTALPMLLCSLLLLLLLLPCISSMQTPATITKSGRTSPRMHRLHAWAPGRRLLHGTGPFARCPACNLMACNPRGRCTGHCRRSRRRHNCAANPAAGGVAESADPAFIAFATAPHIGCNVTTGCTLPPSGIAPCDGLAVALNPNGTATAVCETNPGLLEEFGACMCTYRSADGRDERRSLCAATAEYEGALPRFDSYVNMILEEYGWLPEVMLRERVGGLNARPPVRPALWTQEAQKLAL
eukprot:jgi/Ulvmu1/12636/UM093_0029.1